jgi:hypothetical protein
MKEKLKSLLSNDTFFTSALVLMVGFTSFGLGRLSIEETVRTAGPQTATAGVVFIDPPVSTTTSATIPNQQTQEVPRPPSEVVASKSGTKYHLPNCPGAKQIKPENLIRFNSIESAKSAGYAPASNCPGLH